MTAEEWTELIDKWESEGRNKFLKSFAMYILGDINHEEFMEVYNAEFPENRKQ